METIIKITWDKPEDENWLCADNIKIALSAYCKNTKFEVVEIKPENLKIPEKDSDILKMLDECFLFVQDKLVIENKRLTATQIQFLKTFIYLNFRDFKNKDKQLCLSRYKCINFSEDKCPIDKKSKNRCFKKDTDLIGLKSFELPMEKETCPICGKYFPDDRCDCGPRKNIIN